MSKFEVEFLFNSGRSRIFVVNDEEVELKDTIEEIEATINEDGTYQLHDVDGSQNVISGKQVECVSFRNYS